MSATNYAQPLRLMVFYDGTYFRKGNVYFRYKERRGWFSLPGLHRLLRGYVARQANVDERSAKVVDAHFYGGRVPTHATTDDQLRKDRDFEMALMDAGIQTHFLALRERPVYGSDELRVEFSQKGVDVAITIDALELAATDRYDVAVLIAGDEDFAPVLRRVSAMGKQSLVAYFDIPAWQNVRGETQRGTFASRTLVESATWGLNFNETVSDSTYEAYMQELFLIPQIMRRSSTEM